MPPMRVAEVVIEELAPIRKRYYELMDDVGEMERLLAVGAQQAEAVSSAKVDEMKQRIGFLVP